MPGGGCGGGGGSAAYEDSWQPIETAPRDGTAVWLYYEGNICLGYCEPANPPWREKDSWFLKASFRRCRDGRLPDDIFGTYAHGVEPTHWMPLPEPPAQDQRNDDA